jgi:hypothetical protein
MMLGRRGPLSGGDVRSSSAIQSKGPSSPSPAGAREEELLKRRDGSPGGDGDGIRSPAPDPDSGVSLAIGFPLLGSDKNGDVPKYDLRPITIKEKGEVFSLGGHPIRFELNK